MSHTVWDNAPNGWPGARNTKKPSSSAVWARAGWWGVGRIGLVYIEIKAEKWETAVYILGGLFSVFPSTPRQRQSQELWKMQLVNGHGNVKQSFGPLWFTMQNCRFYSLTFATQCIQHLKCTVVFKCYCRNMDPFDDFQMLSKHIQIFNICVLLQVPLIPVFRSYKLKVKYTTFWFLYSQKSVIIVWSHPHIILDKFRFVY